MNISNFTLIENNSGDGENLNLSDENLKEDLQRINKINKNYKTIACLSLLRNKLNEGFDKITNLISKTVHGKSSTFDKSLVLIMNNCEKNILNESVSEVIIIFFYKEY
jgi:hypothetical protein